VTDPTPAQLRADALTDLEQYATESGDGTWALARATAALARATLASAPTGQNEPSPDTSPTEPGALGRWLRSFPPGTCFTDTRSEGADRRMTWQTEEKASPPAWAIYPESGNYYEISDGHPELAEVARFAPFTLADPGQRERRTELISPTEPEALDRWLRELPDGTGLRLRNGSRDLWQFVREYRFEIDDDEVPAPALLRIGESGAYDLTSGLILARLAEMGRFVVVTRQTGAHEPLPAPQPELVSPTEPKALRAWLNSWNPGTILRCSLFAWQLHPSNIRGQLVLISTDPDGGGERYPLGPGLGDTLHQVAMFAPFTVVYQPDPRVTSPYEAEALRRWVIDYPEGQRFRSARGHAEGVIYQLTYEEHLGDEEPQTVPVLADTEGNRFPLTPGHPGAHELTAYAPLIPLDDD
jgi:hypothetical protein